MELCYNINKRLSDNKQLWIVGCSVTYGVGVKTKERFANLISCQLNLPFSLLAYPGTSIEWAADQILTSDLKNGDIVIWALTGAVRYPFVDGNELLNITPFSYHDPVKPYITEKYFISDDIVHRGKRSILQVKNFTDKVGARLLIGFLPLNAPDTDLVMYDFIKDMKSTVLLYDVHGTGDNLCLDLGTDNQHPGPLTHRYYADMFIKSLKEMQS